VTGGVQSNLASLEVWPGEDIVREARVDDERLHIWPDATDHEELIFWR
jgi:hypothetical protein